MFEQFNSYTFVRCSIFVDRGQKSANFLDRKCFVLLAVCVSRSQIVVQLLYRFGSDVWGRKNCAEAPKKRLVWGSIFRFPLPYFSNHFVEMRGLVEGFEQFFFQLFFGLVVVVVLWAGLLFPPLSRVDCTQSVKSR